MIRNLAGSFVYVDLCEAIDNQILFSIAINGVPPITGIAMGIPYAMKNLITIVVNQEYPYNVVVGLIDISSWSEVQIPDFYIELKDGNAKEGNVTVTISNSACFLSEKTDKE